MTTGWRGARGFSPSLENFPEFVGVNVGIVGIGAASFCMSDEVVSDWIKAMVVGICSFCYFGSYVS